MPKQHTVQLGECVSSIAEENGFFWETVWNHSANAQLRAKRKDPNALVPGDVVVVPDKRVKQVDGATNKEHRFRKKGVPALLRLQLFRDDKVRAEEDYELVVDGTTHQGRTDGQGVLVHPISPTARMAILTIGPDRERFELRFGFLQAIDSIAGAQARLRNLGFYTGEEHGRMDDDTRDALLSFQHRFNLEPSGQLDAATKAKLEKLHDEVGALPA